jgi:hypothetical protein
VAGTPFKSLYLTEKTPGEGCLAPETFVSRLATQAPLHVTQPGLERAPENAQLFCLQVEQHGAIRERHAGSGSDAAGTLTVAWIDSIAEIVLQGSLTAVDVAHGALSQLLPIVAGIVHVLLAKRADHRRGLVVRLASRQQRRGTEVPRTIGSFDGDGRHPLV